MSRLLWVALLATAVSAGCGDARVGTPPDGRAWSAPTTLTTLPTPAADLRLAGTPGGDAFAVWVQVETTPTTSVTRVFARRFVKGSGWEAAKPVSPPSGAAHNPEVAVNGTGDAIVVWEQEDEGVTGVYAALYVAGSGWLEAEDVDTDPPAEDQTAPAVGLDAGGNAVAVWLELVGGQVRVRANSYLVGATPSWQQAETIGTGPTDAAPRVAVNAQGRAVAVWRSGLSDVAAAEYDPAFAPDPWQDATVIDDLDGEVHVPQVAMDSSGRAVAVWGQFDSVVSVTTIRANRLASGNWDASTTRVDDSSVGDADPPALALGATGVGLAVWPQHAGTLSDIHAARFTPSTRWSSTRTIETDNAGSASAPSVAVNDSGAGLAVWQQADGGDQARIWSNAFDPARGWERARRVDQDSARTGTAPRAAIDATGDGVAVWLDGSERVQAATYE